MKILKYMTNTQFLKTLSYYSVQTNKHNTQPHPPTQQQNKQTNKIRDFVQDDGKEEQRIDRATTPTPISS